jgi:tagatose-1,6-bisphosphate aldolase non-catalytic subunit AgaZ/GatZ
MSKQKKATIDKYHLSLAGEYRVASELLKRGLNATVTFGNAKSADVVAYGSNRKAVVVEVKTSQQKNFVTGFYNKYRTPEQEHPDFWVLVQVKAGVDHDFRERFFVLSHVELSVVQARRNRAYRVRCGDVKEDECLSWEKHFILTNDANGVDNVLLTDVEQSEDSENNWAKIVDACNS